MKRIPGYFLILFIAVIFSGEVFSQASLVPSYHPVYEWLYLQRVKGNLPSYDYESLPLTRSTINKYLQTLASDAQYISGKERRTLDSFIQEFDKSPLFF